MKLSFLQLNMKMFNRCFQIIYLISLMLFFSCEAKSTIKCNNDIRAYEFGREMYTWIKLRNEGTLSTAIQEYSKELAIDPPYNAKNECVIKGFEDARNYKESPYNKEGKSWMSF